MHYIAVNFVPCGQPLPNLCDGVIADITEPHLTPVPGGTLVTDEPVGIVWAMQARRRMRATACSPCRNYLADAVLTVTSITGVDVEVGLRMTPQQASDSCIV